MTLGEACHFLDLNLCKAGVELDLWTRQFFEVLLLSDTLQRDFFLIIGGKNHLPHLPPENSKHTLKVKVLRSAAESRAV